MHKYGLHVDPYVPQVIHGRGESFSPKAASSFADRAHHNHFHVEFHKGGLVGGSGEVPALLKSGEMVIDVDSTNPARNLLLGINKASGKEGILKAIKDYASYELGATQNIMIQEPEQQPQQMYQSEQTGGEAYIPKMSHSSFEFLEFQG